MLNELNLTNVIANGGIVVGSLTLSGWLLKKWMRDIENKHDQSVIAVNGVALSAAAAVAQVAKDTAAAVAVVASGSGLCVFTAAQGPAGANTAIQGWTSFVDPGGVTRYMPYW